MSLLDPDQVVVGHRWRRYAAVAGVVVVLWLLTVGVLLMRAKSDATSGLASISAAQRLTGPSDLVAGTALRPLGDAHRSFASAHHRFASLLVAPLRLTPVLGRQLRSATALAAAAEQVSATGVDLVKQGRSALQEPHKTGPERVLATRRIADVAAGAERRLDRVSLGPSRALIGPLARKRRDLVSKLAKVRRSLHDGAVVGHSLASLLDGPHNYLLLAANNAEMRSGSGMFLSVGQATFAHGDLAMGEFRPSGLIGIDAPRTAPTITDRDLADRWGWLNPNREWRNLGASPRFEPNASLAAAMWARVPDGHPVDGVIALDPVALAAILRATGPVQSEGRQVTADNVIGLLLHDQYTGIQNLDLAAQTGRREQLGAIAKTTLAAFQTGGFDMAKLASGLADAARGRHLLVWASDPTQQEAWATIGVDGRMGGSQMMVSVLNRGGNKLDQFLQVDAALEIGRSSAGSDCTLRITLHNTAPSGESIYIQGPYPGSGLGAGDYGGILSVDLPGQAGQLSSDGGALVADGADGAERVVALPVRIPRGASQTFTIKFSLPNGHGRLVVTPSARVPGERWSAPGGSWTDSFPRTVLW